jgi:hypothetical protein
MSYDLSVVFPKGAKFDCPQWNAALAAEGFDLQFQEPFDPRKHSGVLPITYRGEVLGPEYAYHSSFGSGKSAVTLFCHGQEEIEGASVALAVLASILGGELDNPQDPSAPRTASAALEEARRLAGKAKKRKKKSKEPMLHPVDMIDERIARLLESAGFTERSEYQIGYRDTTFRNVAFLRRGPVVAQRLSFMATLTREPTLEWALYMHLVEGDAGRIAEMSREQTGRFVPQFSLLGDSLTAPCNFPLTAGGRDELFDALEGVLLPFADEMATYDGLDSAFIQRSLGSIPMLWSGIDFIKAFVLEHLGEPEEAIAMYRAALEPKAEKRTTPAHAEVLEAAKRGLERLGVK